MARMITRDMLVELHELADGTAPVVSFYLSTLPYREDPVQRGERLLQTLEGRGVEAEQDRIRSFLREELPGLLKSQEPYAVRGVAVFASAPREFFQVYPLPHSVRDLAVADRSPYIRPLSTLLDEYKRYLVVVVDPKKARFYEMFLGAITDAEKLRGIRPFERVKSPPPRRKRHYDYVIAQHYLSVAEYTADLMFRKHFDLLIIGEPRAFQGQFSLYLPFSLREKIAGTMEADPTDDIAVVLARARRVERAYERAEEERTLKRFREILEAGGPAVAGLPAVLDALMHNQLQTILLAEGFQREGVRCPSCGFLGLEEATCPVCGRPTVRVPDVVDDLVEEAWVQGVGVEHVLEAERLKDVGYVGGFLRFVDEKR